MSIYLQSQGLSDDGLTVLGRIGLTVVSKTTLTAIKSAGETNDLLVKTLVWNSDKKTHVQLESIGKMPFFQFTKAKGGKMAVNRLGGLCIAKSSSSTLLEYQNIMFKLIGDNLDRIIKGIYAGTLDKELHFFHFFCKMDEIIIARQRGDTEPEIPIGMLKAKDILPTVDDLEKLLEAVAVISERILVDTIPELEKYERNVPRHIKHLYSDVMANMTAVVPLGLLDKSETSVDGMLSILEDYKPYIPGNPTTKVLCGGDLFTYERHLQAHLSKANEPDDPSHKLHYVFEHWHAKEKYNVNQVKLLHNPESANSPGTYTGNCHLIDNKRAATTDFSQKRVNEAVESMLELNTDVLTCGLFEKEMEREELTFDTLDYAKFQALVRKMIHNLLATEYDISLPTTNGNYECPQCDFIGTFNLVTCHMTVSHGCELTRRKPDHKFNYIRHAFFLGQMMKVWDDSISEGNGPFLTLIWRFLTPFFFRSNNFKYAFAGYVTPDQPHVDLAEFLIFSLGCTNEPDGDNCHTSFEVLPRYQATI
eukprot:sb/3463752/